MRQPGYEMQSLNSNSVDDGYFPSSFMRDKDTSMKDHSGSCCNSKSYLWRRRKFWICFLLVFFVLAGVITTVQLGLFHGHIQGGAGSYLETTSETSVAAPAGKVAATEKNEVNGSPQVKVDSSEMIPKVPLTGATGRKLSIATWNIAAINNNPFEYWLTIESNPKYEELMKNIENFIEAPGTNDIPVNKVFTEDMFKELDARLTKVGWESVSSYWNSDFKDRLIISGFMKDPLLGSKRLASMPDRVTNTINVAGSNVPVCRPTVINMYEGDLGSMEKWWKAWESFMFDTPLSIPSKDNTVENKVPYQMLNPIKKAKYPDITEEEEKVSLPLQTMCGAIFDGILVHMMNTVSQPDVWQPLKQTIVESLNKQKVPKTLEILEQTYVTSDIITLQEVSTALINLAKMSSLGTKFHIIAPKDMDATRDQNSIILLSKETFPGGMIAEITGDVSSNFPEGVDVPVANGDILAITTKDKDNTPYVIASFHGDTNGLATIPVLDAIVKLMTSATSGLSTHKLIFGMDANTYETGKPGKKQDVTEFGTHYRKYDLTSSWGDMPQPSNYTTYNARTYLQPQLNKACKSSEKRTCGDVNPKDFILFGKGQFSLLQTWKDNTGKKEYIEDMAFPTLAFPSDHGILSILIETKPQP